MHKLIKQYCGFTLIELMIGIAIMGIVLAFGGPALQDMIASHRLKTQANSFVGALNIARSEAVKRNKLVVVRKTSTDWKDGWEVFVDFDADNSKDNDDEVIQAYESLINNYSITVTSQYTNYIAYRPDGRSNTNGSFNICSSSSYADFRHISISGSGRIRSETADESGETYASVCE